MFENGAHDSRFLGVMVRLIPHLRRRPVVATICVVTSSPPFAEGGHLVMARELVRALREEGHDTGLVVTPQNRFGRQGSAYLAAWCTDVELAHEERKVDQVISLRFPGYAVQHPQSRAVAQPPDARVLRPVGPVQLAPVVEGQDQGTHAPRDHPSRRSATCCNGCSAAS